MWMDPGSRPWARRISQYQLDQFSRAIMSKLVKAWGA